MSKARLSGQAAQPLTELSLPQLKLWREPGSGSSPGKGSRKLLYWGPQPRRIPTERRGLSSGSVGERSHQAAALGRWGGGASYSTAGRAPAEEGQGATAVRDPCGVQSLPSAWSDWFCRLFGF